MLTEPFDDKRAERRTLLAVCLVFATWLAVVVGIGAVAALAYESVPPWADGWLRLAHGVAHFLALAAAYSVAVAWLFLRAWRWINR